MHLFSKYNHRSDKSDRRSSLKHAQMVFRSLILIRFFHFSLSGFSSQFTFRTFFLILLSRSQILVALSRNNFCGESEKNNVIWVSQLIYSIKSKTHRNKNHHFTHPVTRSIAHYDFQIRYILSGGLCSHWWVAETCSVSIKVSKSLICDSMITFWLSRIVV